MLMISGENVGGLVVAGLEHTKSKISSQNRTRKKYVQVGRVS